MKFPLIDSTCKVHKNNLKRYKVKSKLFSHIFILFDKYLWNYSRIYFSIQKLKLKYCKANTLILACFSFATYNFIKVEKKYCISGKITFIILVYKYIWKLILNVLIMFKCMSYDRINLPSKGEYVIVQIKLLVIIIFIINNCQKRVNIQTIGLWTRTEDQRAEIFTSVFLKKLKL